MDSMGNYTKGVKDIWVAEVAALIADGWAPEKIASKFNFTKTELDQVFLDEKFPETLATHGEAAVTTFAELQTAQAGQTGRRFLRDRLQTYLERLDSMVMSGTLKPEKEVEVLLALVKFGAPADDGLAEENIRLSPATMENIARRTVEFEKFKEAFVPSADATKRGNA